MQNNHSTILNYRISGNGDPVLFLHGFMEDLSMWDHLTANIPVRAIAIDLTGHGKSQLTDTVPSIDTMAEQVMNLVEELGVKNAQIVGHSLGGYVALELMKRNPLFEHATLFHSHPWEDAPSKKTDRNRVIELVKEKAAFFIQEAIPNLFFKRDLTPIIEHYIQIAKKMSPEAIAWSAAAMRDRNDLSDLMIEQASRFTLIQGEHDALISKSHTSSFCKSSGINYIEIESCGHMGHEEQPQKTQTILETILIQNN